MGRQVWRSASSGIVIVFAMIAVTPADARAQGPDYGYVIGAPLWVNSLGSRNFAWFAGVGGERVGADGIGLGGEAGLVILPECQQRPARPSRSIIRTIFEGIVSATACNHL